jgi:hypothetical protein
MNYEQAQKLKPADFKRYFGVRWETFEEMIDGVKEGEKQKIKAGRSYNLSIEDQILMTLQYLREYRTFFHLGIDWGVHESTANRIVEKIEDRLIKSGKFSLPGQKSLTNEDLAQETVAIDVTEIEIERPKKRQKSYYSGKKKKHTLKFQLVVQLTTTQIYCVAMGRGRNHDFHIFKENTPKIRDDTICLADKGYQGLQKYHHNSQTPHKKRKNQPLTEAQKKENQKLASQRIFGEHVHRRLKVFRILSGVYRNRRRRLGLRVHLIAGFHNYELTLPKFWSS